MKPTWVGACFGTALAVIAVLAVAEAGAGGRTPSDQDYALKLHRGLLGRDPGPEELTRTLRDLSLAPYRILIHNLMLDSPEFATRVDDATFLAGLYRQLRGRAPLAHEMVIGRRFLGADMPRSEILGAVLQAGQVGDETPDAELHDRLALSFTPRRLRTYRRDAHAFAQLDENGLRALLAEEEALLAPDRTLPSPPEEPRTGPDPLYNVYYGYLHAHTQISSDAELEGSPGPFAAFDYARNVAGLDFLGLSDHAESISVWPWNNEWRKLGDAVDEFNEDGAFVALRGFEYSNPIYGHLNTFNTSSFISTFGAATLQHFYFWLAQRADAASTYNHPGLYDQLDREFLHFAPFPAVEQQMVGIELLTHDAQYEQYSVGYASADGLGYLDEANQAGWRVASVSAQDNHSGDWGTRDEYRTGVLAPGLTQADILDAVRSRRFFSSQDRNLSLSFRADGREMGARLGPGGKTFSVALEDADGESFVSIDLYGNGALLERREVSGAGPLLFSVGSQAADSYYYVVVTQGDGDRAMSAPIWVDGAATSP